MYFDNVNILTSTDCFMDYNLNNVTMLYVLTNNHNDVLIETTTPLKDNSIVLCKTPEVTVHPAKLFDAINKLLSMQEQYGLKLVIETYSDEVLRTIEVLMYNEHRIDNLMVYYNESHSLKGGKVTSEILNHLYECLGAPCRRIEEESGGVN